MKYPVTEYFTFMRLRPDRTPIQDSWIEYVIEHPLFEEVQMDGRIRRWGKIEEADGRYLRVILLEDRQTVHNAFFDRRFTARMN